VTVEMKQTRRRQWRIPTKDFVGLAASLARGKRGEKERRRAIYRRRDEPKGERIAGELTKEDCTVPGRKSRVEVEDDDVTAGVWCGTYLSVREGYRFGRESGWALGWL
jgi:hypothetical protein